MGIVVLQRAGIVLAILLVLLIGFGASIGAGPVAVSSAALVGTSTSTSTSTATSTGTATTTATVTTTATATGTTTTTTTATTTATATVTTTPGTNIPVATGQLYGIDPVRVLDTRAPAFGPIGFNGSGVAITAGPFLEGDLRTYRIAGKTFQTFTFPAPGVLKGITYNLTAVQSGPTGGFLKIFPGSAPEPASSSLNPSGSTGITSNAGFVTVDASGNVQIKSVGGTRDVVLDVTGFYQ